MGRQRQQTNKKAALNYLDNKASIKLAAATVGHLYVIWTLPPFIGLGQRQQLARRHFDLTSPVVQMAKLPACPQV